MTNRLLQIAFLTVLGATTQASADVNPYITKVYDFVPAPGQFVNTMPEYEQGDSKADIIDKVAECLVGTFYGTGSNMNEPSNGLISLGAFGGYVVFGFDHPIVNVAGAYDFRVIGNAAQSDAYAGMKGGSAEPGIVMVMRDDNGNGLPDDTWYELAGSEHNNAETQKNFTITYYRPNEDKEKEPDPQDNTISDATYIKYNGSATGYLPRNAFHAQPYWPQWYDAKDDTMTFTGTRLPNNGQNMSSGTGTAAYWFLRAFDWGYVDNEPNATDPGLKIDWAVDADGNPVHLDEIHFVKVYSSMIQYCGQVGETSTEVGGAIDLHPDAVSALDHAEAHAQALRITACDATSLHFIAPANASATVLTANGSVALQSQAVCGENSLCISNLCPGIYLLNVGNQTCKFVKSN